MLYLWSRVPATSQKNLCFGVCTEDLFVISGFAGQILFLQNSDCMFHFVPSTEKTSKVRAQSSNGLIFMKYHALFVIFEKAARFEIVVCCKL